MNVSIHSGLFFVKTVPVFTEHKYVTMGLNQIAADQNTIRNIKHSGTSRRMPRTMHDLQFYLRVFCIYTQSNSGYNITAIISVSIIIFKAVGRG